MKNRGLYISAILALVALVAIPVAFAQTEYLKANIPFEFSVSNRTLPAGNYQVKCVSGGSPAVILQGVDVKVAHVVLTQATASRTLPREGKLIFSRYGDAYFLSQIWRPGDRQGNLLPPSKTEREMAAKAAIGATTEVALNR